MILICKECGLEKEATYTEKPLVVPGMKEPLVFGKGLDGKEYVPDLCDDCMSKGWTDDPNEIIDAFNKDPGFSIGIESPYKNL
jgi:hypothetical protein